MLEQHLIKNFGIRVFRISVLWMGFPSESWTFEEKFHLLMEVTWIKFGEECTYIKTVLIVDEAQVRNFFLFLSLTISSKVSTS